MQFDFRYDDTDTLMSELQEFYPYSEMPEIGKLPGLFEESFKTGRCLSATWQLIAQSGQSRT